MQISTPLSILFASVALTPVLAAQAGQEKVDFIEQVYPILKKSCFECHGAEEQEADLRLDQKAGLFVADQEDWVVLPGNSSESELYVRISLPHDDDDIMPSEGDPLKKAEIAIIRQWIEEGADWPAGADALIAKAVAASAPKVEKLVLPPLSAEQQAAEKKAIAALRKVGGLAMRVAANTNASEVNLSLLGEKATNAEVALTAGLSGTLVRLDLKTTAVDDAGLATIGKHGQLRWLNLSNTEVTDAGLAHLSGLGHLRYLNLYGTKVTDAGVQKLAGMKSLQKLFLWQTKVTKRGAAKLEKALPGLMVDLGEYAAVLQAVKKSIAKSGAPINTVCPVTGRKVKPNKTSVYQGQVIGLCCDKCKKRFDKNPAQFIGKVKEFKPAGVKAPIKKAPGKRAPPDKTIANTKCPVGDRELADGVFSAYQGRLIGFCCKKCKAKFDADPRKYLAKLKDIFKK